MHLSKEQYILLKDIEKGMHDLEKVEDRIDNLETLTELWERGLIDVDANSHDQVFLTKKARNLYMY